MTTSRRIVLLLGSLLSLALATNQAAWAQTFGVELHNTLMPASGGMAGTSIANPQDLTSALNGNPAAITQFRGTQFTFGGAWAEPTFNMNQKVPIVPLPPPPLISPFTAKSSAPGLPAGNIGVTQDMSAYDLPITLGVGFVTTSGGFVDFRSVPTSNRTNSGLAMFSIPVTVGVQVAERLSFGATMAMGIAFFDGPFVGVSGMTPDYALRGTLGANYQLSQTTTIGTYYQTEQSYRFDDAFTAEVGPILIAQDVNMQMPQNVGIGIADTSLMEGRLLLAVDVIYKNWDATDLFGTLYDDQWVVQFGSQYTMGRIKLRAGYAWAENPMDPAPGPNLGGIIEPGELPAVRYTQGLMAITGQHRLTVGVGIADVLPGVHMDIMAGGMFRDQEQLGEGTQTTVSSYWLGAGITWVFGRGACEATGDCELPCCLQK